MKITQEKCNRCKLDIVLLERKNLRNKEKSDVAMVDEIIKMIKMYVNERY